MFKSCTTFFCIGLHLFTLSISYAGTESGGGGTTVITGNQHILFDFLVLDPNFKDIDSFGNYSKLTINPDFLTRHKNKIFSAAFNEPVVHVQNKNLKSPADFFNTDPFRLAVNIIQSWQDDNLLNFSTGFILSGLQHPVTWSITDIISIENLMSFENFPLLQVSSPKFAAYYQNNTNNPENKYTIQIAADVWNELGLLSQAGLLIHEGTRHPQISFSQSPSYYFKDSVLQKTTAILMLCEPRPTLSMYISHLLDSAESQIENLGNFGSFEEVVKKYCKRRNYVQKN